MRLRLHRHEYVVARVERGTVEPRSDGALFASLVGPDGNTLVCRAGREPPASDVERGWRLLQVDEPMGFGEVGVIASVVGPLAAAGVAVFVLSTFTYDWVLVRGGAVPLAREALRAVGHEVREDE